jgi:hypothetical protein
VFADAKIGSLASMDSDTPDEVERSEDARKTSVPFISDIVDQHNISDMNPAAKKGHERTPWPLEQKNVKSKKPRYPVPDPRPNIFRPEESQARSKLFYERWAELNRTHNWPAWLVDDRNGRLTSEILEWMYPNILESKKEMRQASLILESINVFLRGHTLSEDSPLYQEKEKTTARRVQRFIKDAERWWEFERVCSKAEAEVNEDEAKAYLKESYEQAKVEGDLDRLRKLEDLSAPQDDSEDDVISLWRKRLDDEE